MKDISLVFPERRYHKSVTTIKPKEPAIAKIEIVVFIKTDYSYTKCAIYSICKVN